MNKKLKKKLIIIFFVIVIIIKIIQINFIKNVRDKIEYFEKLDNSYYKINLINESKDSEITRFTKNRKIKEIIKLTNLDKNIITIIDLDKDEKITIYESSNTYKIEKDNREYDTNLKNLPKNLEIINDIEKNIKEKNFTHIFSCFKILYIIPIKYNDIECYEIRTLREKLYVDRTTLYPLYLEYKKQNSSGKANEKTKSTYIFEENNVKDEDVEIPNLEKYTLIEN
ncbi:MAG: hypothetical protein ACI4UE_04090 [Candidatus Scatovivens sp.]